MVARENGLPRGPRLRRSRRRPTRSLRSLNCDPSSGQGNRLRRHGTAVPLRLSLAGSSRFAPDRQAPTLLRRCGAGLTHTFIHWRRCRRPRTAFRRAQLPAPSAARRPARSRRAAADTVAEREVLGQDRVEALVVAGRRAQAVAEERPRGDVGRAERAEQEVAGRGAAPRSGRASRAARRPGRRGGRRPAAAAPPRPRWRSARPSRRGRTSPGRRRPARARPGRAGTAAGRAGAPRGGAGSRASRPRRCAVVEQDGYERLAAGRARPARGRRVDRHELGVEALVPERQAHALDVGGEGRGEELHVPTVGRDSVKRKRLLLQRACSISFTLRCVPCWIPAACCCSPRSRATTR